MLTPFSSEDLGRMFDSRILTKGRTLILLGTVQVTLQDPSVAVMVEHLDQRHTANFTPAALDRHRVVLLSDCSCGQVACVHVAAGALAALDRFPALRKPTQQNFLGTLAAPAAAERQRLTFDLSPGTPPHACFVSALLVGERTGQTEPTSPAHVLADPASSGDSRALARLLGGGTDSRTPVLPQAVTPVLGLLARLGTGRWHATGRTLTLGADRSCAANLKPDLPPRSDVILGDAGPWYIDGATGAVGRIRVLPPSAAPVRAAAQAASAPQKAAPPSPVPPRFGIPRSGKPRLGTTGRVPSRSGASRSSAPPPAARRVEPPRVTEPVILDSPPAPVLRLCRIECPDDNGRLVPTDALTIGFDYEGVLVPSDDERQFVRLQRPGDSAAHQSFVRRDTVAEAASLDLLRQDGFNQMRIADAANVKGRIVYVFRGRDAAERWQLFARERVPALQSLGWRNQIDKDFGPRHVQAVGNYDVRISDAAPGSFELDFGIEVDGARIPLLPILSRLLDRGGMEAAQVVDGMVVTSLDDGRILKLPADRIGRLLAVMADLIEAARRTADNLVLPQGEAASMLELEDLLPTRWENAAAIETYAERFRRDADIPPVVVPASFKAELRPYQQHGVAWLQHLRAQGVSGFLADDMGLGKTAQTIAHIVIEHAEGRLDRPVLVVVPTSLVANWTAELTKFAPHLRVIVLHGGDRHARRAELDRTEIAITTYTVLARDIEEMKQIPWHLVVLDEAQVIKSPDAKATKAVCRLDTRHRLCLSGTPIENNLQELWSEFTFLMPGLLGSRKGFAKRFRTPIEKNGDAVRRVQLIRRIKPFLLRRTKHEVATDLPPKHTILRRVDLAPEQRELYETIRGTLHDRVREQLAGLGAAQGRIVMLDALLKLRQVCCDPRLVKLPSARLVQASSKLDDLLEMVSEMVPEGRRILLFSQFTSMLDLIKPRLTAAGIRFVELRGDTIDRAEPVRVFESGAVPVFLISLKAGGRGLNLVSADTVIHYDPWWNPAAEDQASDRAHRIGQTKSVFIYKMIAANTVEDRILELQQSKASLANIALSGEGELGGLEIDDMEFLFGDGTKQMVA